MIQVWLSPVNNGGRHIIIKDHDVIIFDEWIEDWIANQLADAYRNIGANVDREN